MIKIIWNIASGKFRLEGSIRSWIFPSEELFYSYMAKFFKDVEDTCLRLKLIMFCYSLQHISVDERRGSTTWRKKEHGWPGPLGTASSGERWWLCSQKLELHTQCRLESDLKCLRVGLKWYKHHFPHTFYSFWMYFCSDGCYYTLKSGCLLEALWSGALPSGSCALCVLDRWCARAWGPVSAAQLAWTLGSLEFSVRFGDLICFHGGKI